MPKKDILEKLTPEGYYESSRLANPLVQFVNSLYKNNTSTNRNEFITNVIMSLGDRKLEDRIASDRLVSMDNARKTVVRELVDRTINYQSNNSVLANTVEDLREGFIEGILRESPSNNVFIELTDAVISQSNLAQMIANVPKFSAVENIKQSFTPQRIEQIIGLLSQIKSSGNLEAYNTIFNILMLAGAFFDMYDILKMLSDKVDPNTCNTVEMVSKNNEFIVDTAFVSEVEDSATIDEVLIKMDKITDYIEDKFKNIEMNWDLIDGVISKLSNAAIRDIENIIGAYDSDIARPQFISAISPIIIRGKNFSSNDIRANIVVLYLAAYLAEMTGTVNPQTVLASYAKMFRNPIQCQNFNISLTEIIKTDILYLRSKMLTYSEAKVKKDITLMDFSVKCMTFTRGISRISPENFRNQNINHALIEKVLIENGVERKDAGKLGHIVNAVTQFLSSVTR